jgi:hypothetical protein
MLLTCSEPKNNNWQKLAFVLNVVANMIGFRKKILWQNSEKKIKFFVKTHC